MLVGGYKCVKCNNAQQGLLCGSGMILDVWDSLFIYLLKVWMYLGGPIMLVVTRPGGALITSGILFTYDVFVKTSIGAGLMAIFMSGSEWTVQLLKSASPDPITYQTLRLEFTSSSSLCHHLWTGWTSCPNLVNYLITNRFQSEAHFS